MKRTLKPWRVKSKLSPQPRATAAHGCSMSCARYSSHTGAGIGRDVAGLGIERIEVEGVVSRFSVLLPAARPENTDKKKRGLSSCSAVSLSPPNLSGHVTVSPGEKLASYFFFFLILKLIRWNGLTSEEATLKICPSTRRR